MDDEIIPRLHDKMSGLVILSDLIANILESIAQSARMTATAVAQHAIQVNTDHEFSEIIGGIDDDPC